LRLAGSTAHAEDKHITARNQLTTTRLIEFPFILNMAPAHIAATITDYWPGIFSASSQRAHLHTAAFIL